MIQRLYTSFLALTLMTQFSFADIKGFEDPALLEKVMSGQIVMQKIIDTTYEAKVVVRSFFAKVSSDAYQDLTINYPKYPDLFQEVQSGTLLKSDETKGEHYYRLDVLAGSGLFQQHVYPEGRHTLIRSKDVQTEAQVIHDLLNFKDMVDVAKQSIRLISYEDGILVEDTVHMKVKPSAPYAKMVKKYLLQFMTSYTEKLRNELNRGYQAMDHQANEFACKN